MACVQYETEGPVAWVTLDRPEYRNAQNVAMLRAVSYTHLTLPTNREV